MPNILKGNIKKDTLNESQHAADSRVYLTLDVIKRLEKLQLVAGRYLPGKSVGARPAFRRKPTNEFMDYRKYVHGDDVRFVDWKASARSSNIYLKQGNYPKEATVHILLDCSASMAWGNPSKSKMALSLVAMIGYLALAHQDRLVLYMLHDDNSQWLGPINGKGQIPSMVKAVADIKFYGKVQLYDAIKNLSHRTFALHGLTFIISDFIETNSIDNILRLFPIPTWNVNVIHLLHRDELNPPIKGSYEFIDVETNEKVNVDVDDRAIETYMKSLTDWQKQLELDCINNNAFYTLIPSDWSLVEEVIPHFMDVHLVHKC